MNPQDSVPAPSVPSQPLVVNNPPTSTSNVDGPIELLKSGWRLFTNHWKILVPIIILPSIISYIGQLFGSVHQIILTIISILISITGAVFSLAMLPALVNAVHRISTESSTNVSLKGQYSIGFKYFWSILLVGIILGLVQIGSFILLVIPYIIVAIYVCLYIFTLVIDDKRGFAALTESYSLIRGRWWGVFGRLLFLGLVMTIVWLIFVGIGFLIGAVSGIHLISLTQPVGQTASVSAGVMIISVILNLIASSILTPIGLGYAYRMYISLKATRNSNISTVTFKRWLIAFICVGVIGGILILISIPLIAISVARSKAQSASADAQARMQQIQAEILKQMGTSTIQGNRPGGAGSGTNY